MRLSGLGVLQLSSSADPTPHQVHTVQAAPVAWTTNGVNALIKMNGVFEFLMGVRLLTYVHGRYAWHHHQSYWSFLGKYCVRNIWNLPTSQGPAPNLSIDLLAITPFKLAKMKWKRRNFSELMSERNK